MKKLALILIAIGFLITAKAQKTIPEIKVGTVMQSTAYYQGQEYPLILTVKQLTAPITFGWSVEGYGEGTFVVNEKAIQNGTELFTGLPSIGANKLSDTETYAMLSKSAYKKLVEEKAFSYNGAKFKPKTTADANPLKLGGKEIDVTHVISEDGKIELWVLNNPDLPMVMQSVGLPIDVAINELK